MSSPPPSRADDVTSLRQSIGAFRYGLRALRLVWATSPRLTILLGALTLVAGVLPAAVAWIGQHIVDSVVAAAAAYRAQGDASLATVFGWVALEGVVVAVLAAAVHIGGDEWLTAARLVVGAAFLGCVTDAMLLGHWYLVQPGLSREPIKELVRCGLWLTPVEIVLMLVSPGMIDVLNGTIGVQMLMFEVSSLRVAGVLPLRDEDQRFFDSEIQVQFNRRF